jgi:hypothetical protein
VLHGGSEKTRLATIVQALIRATSTAVWTDATWPRSEYAIPVDTISAPTLIANASEAIALSEDATLASTRKAAATPRASHEMKRAT